MKPFCVVVLGASFLLAQQQPGPTYSAGVKVVNILATVTDKHGKVVSNLSQGDFSLTEDGNPQQIRYFARETDLPLTMGLLVDTSMSERRVLPDEKNASEHFLNEVLREDKDRAFLIHFDREIELLQDLTSSRKKLESAIGLLEIAGRPQGNGQGRQRRGGGTALYDAVLLASQDLMRKQTGRKALIVLSDGEDNGSKVTLEEAVEAAQRSDSLVYSILFKDEEGGGFNRGFGGGGRGMGGYGGRGRGRMPPPQRIDGKKILERISKETGGTFFEVSKKQPIDRIYAQLQDELRNQYNLGYSPDKTETAGYHRIQLTVKEKNLEVRARDGYYAGSAAASTK